MARLVVRIVADSDSGEWGALAFANDGARSVVSRLSWHVTWSEHGNQVLLKRMASCRVGLRGMLVAIRRGKDNSLLGHV